MSSLFIYIFDLYISTFQHFSCISFINLAVEGTILITHVAFTHMLDELFSISDG